MRKTFAGSCPNCGKIPLSKNEVGINRKLLGDAIDRPMCMSCLAEYLEVSEDDLFAKIEEFKTQGCKLFS